MHVGMSDLCCSGKGGLSPKWHHSCAPPPPPGLDNDGNRAALGWEFQESREGTARYLHIVGVGQLLPVSVSLLLHHILPHPFIFIL